MNKWEMNIKEIEAHEVNKKRDRAREIAKELNSLVEEMEGYNGNQFDYKECPMKKYFDYGQRELLFGVFGGYSLFECPFCGDRYEIDICGG